MPSRKSLTVPKAIVGKDCKTKSTELSSKFLSVSNFNDKPLKSFTLSDCHLPLAFENRSHVSNVFSSLKIPTLSSSGKLSTTLKYPFTSQ